MELLLEINDQDLGLGRPEQFDKRYEFRKAARAVLFRDDGQIAFQYISKQDYYKLPGGGVDQGETIEQGLHREILEEVGAADIKIKQTIGIIIEYRDKGDIMQISYCYVAEVVGELVEPTLEAPEIEDGLTPIWVSFDQAIDKLKKSQPKDYNGHFIVKRDLAFLEKAKELLIK